MESLPDFIRTEAQDLDDALSSLVVSMTDFKQVVNAAVNISDLAGGLIYGIQANAELVNFAEAPPTENSSSEPTPDIFTRFQHKSRLKQPTIFKTH